jgi:hypothetical protein
MDAAWMGKELAKAGIRKAAKGAPNVIVDGRKTRVHIIGASPEWVALLQAMSVKEIEILMAGAPPVPPRKFEEQRARVN